MLYEKYGIFFSYIYILFLKTLFNQTEIYNKTGLRNAVSQNNT